MLARMWRKRISFALLVGMQAGAATLENSMEVPQKTKNRTTLRPSNCTTRHLPKRYRCVVLKGHMHPHVYSSTINNIQIMERAQMSINWWMDKEDVVHMYNGILLSHQIEWNLAICSDMDGARMYYAKWKKSIREWQIPCDFTHMWNLRKQEMNIREGGKKRGKQTIRDSTIENKLRVGEGLGQGMG